MLVRRTRRRSNFTTLKLARTAAIAFFVSFILNSCSGSATDAYSSALTYVSSEAGVNGEFGEPFGIAAVKGDIFVSDGAQNCIWRLTPAGPVVFASGLDTPSAMAISNDGDLIVADTGSHTIRSIDRSGGNTIIAGVPGRPGMEDSEAASATFNGPIGVAVAKDGSIYVSDTYNDRIRLIKDGKVSTVAGGSRGFADGEGPNARFNTPTGLAIWGDELLVADTGNGRIRAIDPGRKVSTLAGSDSGELTDGLLSKAGLLQPSAIAVDETAGRIFFADGNSIRAIESFPFATIRTLTSDVRGLRDGRVHRARFNRPSGLSISAGGDLLVADSENGLIRRFSQMDTVRTLDASAATTRRGDPAKFRSAAPARWPFDPPEAPRDIAGTLGEIRGEIGPGKEAWFHNGLDIAGAYGETARFIRDEKVLRPLAAENFGTLREMLRMPAIGYIHIRLGRDQTSVPFGDPRFLFDREPSGKMTGVRVPRGAKFSAGEPIGTLNPMNHVHLIAGPSGYEMNALDALSLPGLVDRRPPTIEKISLFDENWVEFETERENSRINLTRKARVVVRAFDQMDGNPERRRLGVYSVRYVLRSESPPMQAVRGEWKFDRLPAADAVPMFYAVGSRSGAEGVTVFNYIATTRVDGDGITDDFLDPEKLGGGNFTLTLEVADYFGNTATRDITFEVNR